MPLDEQDLVEVEQRIREGDAAPQLAGLIEQFAASRIVGRVDLLTRLLELGQIARAGSQIGLRLQFDQVVEERGSTADHDVGRVSILVQNQGFTPKSGCRDLRKRGSVGQLACQHAKLGIPFHGRLGGRMRDQCLRREPRHADDDHVKRALVTG